MPTWGNPQQFSVLASETGIHTSVVPGTKNPAFLFLTVRAAKKLPTGSEPPGVGTNPSSALPKSDKKKDIRITLPGFSWVVPGFVFEVKVLL